MLKNVSKLGFLIKVLLVVYISSLIVVHAYAVSWATACSVWTTDAHDNPKVEFAPDETVYVHWKANGMINMTVCAPDGVTIDQEWTYLPEDGVNSFAPSHGNGIYEIECTGAATTPIAVGTILVIPQLPLGTLLALCTMFGAVFIIKKRRSH